MLAVRMAENILMEDSFPEIFTAYLIGSNTGMTQPTYDIYHTTCDSAPPYYHITSV